MSSVVDVLVVGYGPVGQVLAATLGRQGHRVRVIERQTSLYHQSRAGTLDHEVMRVLQSLGIASALEPSLARAAGMDLVDADHEVITALPLAGATVSGWHATYTMYQPDLETALDAAVRTLPSVEIVSGWEVVGLEQTDHQVEVTSRRRGSDETRVDTARYVVGADGANSAVRALCGLESDDLGYHGPWLVGDFEHHEPDVALDFASGFVLDPERPLLYGRWLGRRHSRFEFMIKPGEDPLLFDDPEVCWKLVAPFGITAETSLLARHAVYSFGSLLAREWRSGRVLLAGDAAHVMPPFMGQGLCAGVRDVANLGWKLDLVLRDEAATALLDTYRSERRPHVEQMIRQSMALGAMVSVTDPGQAAGRNEFLRTQPAPPPPALPPFVEGVLRHEPDGAPRPGVGGLGLQGVVEQHGERGRLDDMVGGGWRVLTRRAPAPGFLSAAQQALLARLGASIVAISPARTTGSAVDVDLDYNAWFDTLHADAVVVRPDFHVFAVLRSVQDLGPALDDLAEQLCLT